MSALHSRSWVSGGSTRPFPRTSAPARPVTIRKVDPATLRVDPAERVLAALSSRGPKWS